MVADQAQGLLERASLSQVHLGQVARDPLGVDVGVVQPWHDDRPRQLDHLADPGGLEGIGTDRHDRAVLDEQRIRPRATRRGPHPLVAEQSAAHTPSPSDGTRMTFPVVCLPSSAS